MSKLVVVHDIPKKSCLKAKDVPINTLFVSEQGHLYAKSRDGDIVHLAQNIDGRIRVYISAMRDEAPISKILDITHIEF